jgi:lipoate-protein ligase A
MFGSSPQLRVIFDPPATGAWNMAVDEALLLSDEHDGLTLRFYEWAEPTLSLGYFQAVAERDRHPASLNCPIVRRASGGGAIVHDRELTYSLFAPVPQRFGASAQALYSVVHQSLCEVLTDWGLHAQQYAPTRLPNEQEAEPFLCFQRRSPGDVVLAEHKICGSAQRRHLSRILQHGSLLLARSFAAPELQGLQNISDSAPDLGSLRGAWLARLAQVLRVRAYHSELFIQEKLIAERLAEGKFQSPSWTFKR